MVDTHSNGGLTCPSALPRPLVSSPLPFLLNPSFNPAPGPKPAATMAFLTRYRSYSLAPLRKASMRITRRKTPMTDPAKAPLVLTCQVSARKHESTVYQFHSIETGYQRLCYRVVCIESLPRPRQKGGRGEDSLLQLDMPIPMSIAASAEEALALVPIPVISISSCPSCLARSLTRSILYDN